MHNWSKEILKCVKTRVEAKGLDNIDLQELTELELWTRVASNIAKADYHCKIIDAMEESGAEYGEDYDYKGRKPYTRMRDNRGRYMKGYEEPMMYDERMEDYKHGKMYYSEPSHSTSNTMHNANESSYDKTRRMFTETKAMNPHDKNERLAKFNKHIDAVEDDFMDLKDDLTPEERTTAKQRFVNMSNKM